MRAAAFALVLVLGALAGATGCTRVRSCKGGTAFVTLQLGAAAAADRLDVGVSVAGGSAMTSTLDHTPGQAISTVEIDFSGQYPTGAAITVAVSARGAAGVLGAGSSTFPATPGCASATITIGAAATDGGVSDGAPVDLAGGDLASDGSVQPPWCRLQATQPLAAGTLVLCDDFERAPDAGWTKEAVDGGSSGVDPGFGFASSSSAFADVPFPVSVNAVPGAWARLAQLPAGAAGKSKYHLALYVYPDGIVYTGGAIWFATLYFAVGASDTFLLMISASQSQVVVQQYRQQPFSVQPVITQSAPLTALTWSNVLLDLDATTSPPTASLTINGARIGNGPLTNAPANLTANPLHVQVGINNATGIDSAKVHVDDVALFVE